MKVTRPAFFAGDVSVSRGDRVAFFRDSRRVCRELAAYAARRRDRSREAW
jgi:hypothetical protein